MNTLIIISTEHDGLNYSLFYMAAFLFAGGVFIYKGLRNHYPARTWLVLALFGAMCFIIGNKLVTVNPKDLLQLFRDGTWPGSGRSVLGGILGMILGAVIVKKWLKIQYPVLDLMAYALPISMIIIRLGCLFAGCCFGKPTDLPWGIQYGTGSIPFQFHADHHNALLQGNLSPSIHPTQIYDMLFCLVIILLLLLTRKSWKAGGNRFLFVVFCYACFRFFEEFFRETYSGSVFEESMADVKWTQWMLLGSVLILGLILFYRERYRKSIITENIFILPANPLREFLLFASVPLFLALAAGWLDIFEKLTLWIFFLPPLFVYLYNLYCYLTIPALRWAVPFIALLAFIAMSQALVPDKDNMVTYKQYGLGTMIGSYYEHVKYLDDYGCGPSYSDEHDRRYMFNTTGFEFSKHQIRNTYENYGMGVKFYLGFQGMRRAEDNSYEGTDFMIGINPYMSRQWKGFGFDLGAHLGWFKYAIIIKGPSGLGGHNIGEYVGAPADLFIFPQMSLRFGRIDILYLDANVANHFPSSSPLPLLEGGLATGLGRMDGTMIGFGISDVGMSKPGFYGKATIPLKKGYLIEGSYADNFKGGTAGGWVFSIGFHHLFDYQTEPQKQKKVKAKK